MSAGSFGEFYLSFSSLIFAHSVSTCAAACQMCVSALVEANGLYLEPVLHAIAEQLPALWERARDSVPIHSCLLSGELVV